MKLFWFFFVLIRMVDSSSMDEAKTKDEWSETENQKEMKLMEQNSKRLIIWFNILTKRRLTQSMNTAKQLETEMRNEAKEEMTALKHHLKNITIENRRQIKLGQIAAAKNKTRYQPPEDQAADKQHEIDDKRLLLKLDQATHRKLFETNRKSEQLKNHFKQLNKMQTTNVKNHLKKQNTDFRNAAKKHEVEMRHDQYLTKLEAAKKARSILLPGRPKSGSSD